MIDQLNEDFELVNTYNEIFTNFYMGSILTDTNQFDYVFCCTYDIVVKPKQKQFNIHVPFNDDNTIPDINYLLDIVSLVEFALDNHKKVYIHCTSGMNRSALICALLLIKVKCYSPIEAIEHLRAIRSGYVLNNQKFYNWLINDSLNLI